jgi:hypothetical protein
MDSTGCWSAICAGLLVWAVLLVPVGKLVGRRLRGVGERYPVRGGE